MRKVIAVLFLMFLVSNLFSQVRNGWRSIYDTSGRLTRMSFYKNGVDVTDSNFYFQYYTDNVIKGIITGEIVKEGGCRNGWIILFDESGNLTSFSVKREGQVAFNFACDYLGVCNGKWIDAFDVNTNCWLADSSSIENGELILHNEKNIGVALYRPPVPIDLNCDFVFQTKIPKDKNSSKVGVCLGWDSPENYYLFEISYGESYSALCYEDGVYKPLVEGRRPIEKKGDNFNEIRISRNGTNLIFEVNQNIEMVLPAPRFKTSTIGLMTRSKGNARFMDFGFTYSVPKNSWLYMAPKIGKGTGFFISTSGRILTTYDAIAGTKSIFVKGKIGEKSFLLPAEIVGVEEEKNLAILQISDRTFHPFKELPYGFSLARPASESGAFSIGFPNAVSGIYLPPEIFPGKVLSSSAGSSRDLLLEMSFRYGMIGAPVFDNNANLIGIVANKGMELKYSEVIDFSENSRLIKGYMGGTDENSVSPLRNKTIQERNKALSEIVVIVETRVFDSAIGEN